VLSRAIGTSKQLSITADTASPSDAIETVGRRVMDPSPRSIRCSLKGQEHAALR
jgi:hypothetical protein